MSTNRSGLVSKSRTARGASMGLVIACCFVLVMIVVGLFYLSMFMGGADEIRNASSAGALNLGKHLIIDDEFKVDPAAIPDSDQFNDLFDKKGKIGLANINSIWAKALLAEANAEQMAADGQAGSSKANADAMFNTAKQISDLLADKVSDVSKQIPVFEKMSEQNSARMLGEEAQVKALKGFWKTSLTDRGAISNLEVPGSAVMPSDSAYSALKLVDNRLPGYTTLQLNGKKFCFVPFADKERTHIISKSEFDENTEAAKAIDGAPDWGKAVPNTFSCQGASKNQNAAIQNAVACVVCNPQKVYKMSMPHAFLHIKLDDNTATWLMNSPTPPWTRQLKKLQVEQATN
ncbi:MAG: hypothetical protein K2X27_11495 [Candidatus Obscuribacterales bacterium]|nr:hypothetical protein [Candidatus Obscuribacterales bacterium]